MDIERCPQKSGIQDTAVQCELLLDNQQIPRREFDILDVGLRRKFVRRFYFLVMLQYALSIPCLEIYLLYAKPTEEQPIVGFIQLIYFIAVRLLYILLYIFRNWRRSAPFNYLVYLLTTVTTATSITFYLIPSDLTRWVHSYPLMFIAELLVLVLYTKQQRFKFSHAIGVIIIYVVFGLMLVLAYFLGVFSKIFGFYACTVEVWYTIYDTHLMLCGVHGYNLKANEYLYAAANIHADCPKFMWMLIRYFIFGPFRELIRLLRSSRSNQIC